MTATLQGIDLTARVLAPAAIGQAMTYAGPETGALCLAGWVAVSALVEFRLLGKLYALVPALAALRTTTSPQQGAL